DLLAFQGGETSQLHVEDRASLKLIDVEQIGEAVTRIFHSLRPADKCDDLVKRVESFEVSAQDVRAFLGLSQTVLGTANDDVNLVCCPCGDETVDSEGPRDAVNDRQHVGAEVLLQLRVLVQVVENYLG